MPEDNLKTSVLTSLFWKLLERGGVTGVQFIVQIILARLLLPEDFGVIALIIVFISISQTFVQSGLGTALIQKKEVTDEDYSSVFYLTLGVAIVFYCILFLASPFIAAFYNQPLISPVLRVLGLTLFFGAINSIQNAVIARNFQFRKLFISSLGAVLLSGGVGVAMAHAGYGVWALVGQQLTSIIALCTIMWFTVQWRPKLLFSLTRVKELFSFGWKLLVSGLIDVTYNNISSLVIGRLYPASMLGYYTKGQEFPKVLVSNINSSIQAVMFPAYSRNQDNRPLVKQIVRRSLVTSSFLVFPAMAGLAAIAEPLIELLLTEKWLMCVPFLQIFCAVYALWPIHTANLQAINALGRSDVFLKLEIVKKVIGLSVLAVTIPIGIYAMALGMVVTGVIGTLINAYPNKKLLDYSFTELWKDLMPALTLSLVMCGIVYSIQFLGLSIWATLILQIMVGVGVYVGLAWLLKLESLTYMMNTVKEYVPGRKGSC
ncbi:lipopolysaccharide biosynthesis protein [Methanofollis fontis]|uniref:Flippase n=1 Tax=Methanofollis fontis TaxID=2052832 RepID=A0A483CLL3_9EURY|nr:lipopolysaccharide biosynthesis protein [Methanofollis fontis]TAJ43696.1 flippase [Methanofollis fontis]